MIITKNINAISLPLYIADLLNSQNIDLAQFCLSTLECFQGGKVKITTKKVNTKTSINQNPWSWNLKQFYFIR